MKKIISAFAFVIAIAGAFAFRDVNSKFANTTVEYLNTATPQGCSTTTCSTTGSAACAQPADYSSGFFQNGSGCVTSVTVFRKL